MKIQLTIAACAAIVLASLSPANAQNQCPASQAHARQAVSLRMMDDKPQGKQTKDIVDTAVAAGSFKTLVTAVAEAGLVDTLKSKGPFTVFAPTDDAFAKLPEGTLKSLLQPENREKLQSILKYHVAPGKLEAKDVTRLRLLETVLGQDVRIKVDGENVFINDAKITAVNIQCSNGVIHVIDAVIIPE